MADKQTLELLIKVIASEAAKQVKEISGDFKELGDKAKNASKGVKESLDGSDGLSSALKTVKNELSNLAAVAAAVKIDKTVGSWAVSALEVSSSFQGIKDEFGIMLHDVEAGAAFFDELQQFNFWTPFDIETTSKAAKVLYSAKVPLGEITDYLTRFGDIAQGDSQKFDSFIRAFSKASAKGKADMEVLNVFTDQGVQILDELGKQFNVTSAEIVDMASKGEISFQALDAALESMASEGGLYFGTLEKASQRLDSVYAGLQESTKSLAASLGDTLAPLATKLLTAVTDIVDAINDSPLLKGVLVAAITAVVAAVNLLAGKALVALIAKLWATFTAQMAANSAMAVVNPLLLAGIAAVTVAVGAYTAYAAKQQEVANASNAAALALQKESTAVDDLNSRLNGMSDEALQFNLNGLLELKDSTFTKLEEAKDKLNKLEGSFIFGRLRINDSGEVEGTSAYDEQKKVVDELQASYDQLCASVDAYNAKIKEKADTAALEEANTILERRDELYSKTNESQLAQLEEDLAFAKSLLTLQTMNEDGTYSGFNVDKTNAIISELEKKIADLKSSMAGPTPPAFTEDWVSKNLEGIAKIAAEEEKSKAQLAEKAKASFGDEYATREEYITQLGALEEYYANRVAEEKKRQAEEAAEEAERLAEEERQRILNQHQEKLNQLREEYELQKEMARENGDYAGYAAASAGEALSQTQLGQVAMGMDPITMFIDATLEAVMQIESLNRVLNFVTTIVGSIMAYLTPVIDEIFNPIAELLEDIGDMLGQLLAPALGAIAPLVKILVGIVRILLTPLQLLGDAFEWLYNEVIVPVGNKFIDIINGVIKALNKIPFVEIKQVDKLKVIGEKAEEVAKSLEQHTKEIKKKYERQKDAVNDLLDAQLDSLKSQYQLGLISRDQFNQQALQYYNAADREIIDIETRMEQELAQINANTYAALTESQQEEADAVYASHAEELADSWGEKAGVIGTVAGAVAGGVWDLGEAIWDGVTGAVNAVSDWVSGWWPFDVGTTNITQDHAAIVHQGEAIIPRTFAEGIRSGDMALVGGKSSSNTSQPVTVVVNVGGSVVTERQIVDVVYDGIARAIGSGEKTPLPGAA
ncbi:MAG: tape measure protein [Treponema sp.]|nr:tape measure protein [Candidatus Treponema caballi]